MASKLSSGKFVIGAIVGAVAGIAAGILTAPKSGKATRRDLKKTADKFKKQGGRELDKLGAEIESVKDDLAKKAGRLHGKAKSAAMSTGDAIKKTTKK